MRKTLHYFNKLVDSLESLPAIGKKSALKLAYHLSINDKYTAHRITHAIENAIKNVRLCQQCNGLSENEICEICLDDTRISQKVCLVQSPQDIFLIEEGNNFDGRYFVLEEINEELINRLLAQATHISEIIFAFSSSIQNESMMLYIEDKLKDFDILFFKIATGVPTGVKLENVDTLSLSQALTSKVPI